MSVYILSVYILCVYIFEYIYISYIQNVTRHAPGQPALHNPA